MSQPPAAVAQLWIVSPDHMSTLEERWKKFVEWSDGGILVIACRKCGSSYLDAGLPSTKLHCCLCGTTTHFDDERFVGLRVSRPFEGLTENQKALLLKKLGQDFGYPHDSVETLKKKDAEEGDLHHDLLQALNSFLSEFSGISSNLNTDAEARSKLSYEWDAAKTRLDIIIRAIQEKG